MWVLEQEKISKMSNNNYVTYILDLLEPLGGIRSRKMFGGHGIYQYDHFFAIIADDTLYFKVNKNTVNKYKELDSKPFTYRGKGKEVSLNYWAVPLDIMENRDELEKWVAAAVHVAKQAKK